MKNKKEEKKGTIATFKKLWANERSRAGIQLGFYLIFIILVIVVINIGSNLKNDVTPTETKITIQTMKDKLSENNYKYEYVVTSSDQKIMFSGEKNGTKESGIKQTDKETLKYLIENNIVYEVKMDEKLEIDNFYENIDERFLNTEFLLKEIKDKSSSITKDESLKKYTYQFEIDDEFVEICLKTDDSKIVTITSNYKDTIYELNFSNYGKVN